MQTNARTTTGISHYFLGGLIAGIVGAIIANIYFLIFSSVTGYSYAELNLFSITLAGIIPSVIGALVYFGLSRMTAKATTLFVALGIVLGALSALPVFIAPPNPAPGFAAATTPMHLIVALSAVIIIPLFVQNASKRNNG
jgi:uncharacterized membrane protein YeaQ/YmgE (transglycosylase-associated protein family)